MEQLFHQEDLKEGGQLLSENKIGSIIFSGGTYQVEVFDKQESYWIFLQFDTNDQLTDYFCMCPKGEKEKSCKHLAAAVSAIYRGRKNPLHVRYNASLWRKLFSRVGFIVGYETTVVRKVGEGEYIQGKEEDPFFSITFKSSAAKQRAREWIDEREEETEETSIKFSNLSIEELEDYRRGILSPELSYELSFWSDLAKWLAVSEDLGRVPKITFHGDLDKLPEKVTVTFDDIEFTQQLTKEIWTNIILALSRYETPLRVHEFKDREIEKITYDEEAGRFYLHSRHIAVKEESYHSTDLGDWLFLPKLGFFPKKVDPLLAKDCIDSDDVSEFLTKHIDLVEKYLTGAEVYKTPHEPKYNLYFDAEGRFHICLYLFKPEEGKSKSVRFYDPWVYIPKKGFFLLEAPVFKGIEKIIPRDLVPEFIEKHKNWLSRYEEFRIHLTSFESKLSYKMDGGTLEIYGDEVLQEKSSDLIDFGPWIYVKREGFFSKGKDREGEKKVYSGLKISSHDLSDFIDNVKEELEQIKGFFYGESGLEKTGLVVSLGEKGQILIEPKYIFREEAKKCSPQIFGNYIYYENKGFAEIPMALRIPKKYGAPSVVSSDRIPYFMKNEMQRIEPYLLEIDRRLTQPLRLKLYVKRAGQNDKAWKIQFAYGSNLGEVGVLDVYSALLQFSPFIFSDAGRISLKDRRFSWLMKINKDVIDRETGEITMTTLEWIKMLLYEEVHFVKTSDIEQSRNFDRLKNLGSSQLATMPNLRGLKSKLRPYQEIGVQWLWFLYTMGLPGGFLCDDMGLGKTHQAMALLAAIMNEKKKSERRKFLVVCPTSVIYHWQELLKTFLKKARVLIYHGPFRSTRELKKSYDIILTTYGIVRSDKELFREMGFELIILDEVQIAKNERSQINQTLKHLQAEMKLALTGTPIENNLGELKSLFDITIPKFLPTAQEFKEQFVLPIEKDADRERSKFLSQLIAPFILRRRKQDVLDDLPEKCEEIAYVDLADDQKRLYDQVASQTEVILGEEESSDFYLHVFALLNKLKQICNHPAMVYKDIAGAGMYGSGKWDFFTEILSEARRSGQKLVVFSQFLDMIQIMENYLKQEGIGYACIKGATQKRKQELIRFRSDPKCEVFIGSLGAAGVGIDLTAASIVVHYDRWWNPAKENQATDRVHRIGQKRGVMVFKLVSKGTIEEHIHQIIEKKKGLIDKIVGYDNQDDFKKLDREEVVWLLKQIQKDIHNNR